jgi:hypothetical protein
MKSKVLISNPYFSYRNFSYREVIVLEVTVDQYVHFFIGKKTLSQEKYFCGVFQ